MKLSVIRFIIANCVLSFAILGSASRTKPIQLRSDGNNVAVFNFSAKGPRNAIVNIVNEQNDTIKPGEKNGRTTDTQSTGSNDGLTVDLGGSSILRPFKKSSTNPTIPTVDKVATKTNQSSNRVKPVKSLSGKGKRTKKSSTQMKADSVPVMSKRSRLSSSNDSDDSSLVVPTALSESDDKENSSCSSDLDVLKVNDLPPFPLKRISNEIRKASNDFITAISESISESLQSYSQDIKNAYKKAYKEKLAKKIAQVKAKKAKEHKKASEASRKDSKREHQQQQEITHPKKSSKSSPSISINAVKLKFRIL